ncbi:MAG: tetratricopeptide repeat protein [Clostridiaceae bacterium]|nr:tetratricopeptide repeat protein [Clostridiaceae bacterium]
MSFFEHIPSNYNISLTFIVLIVAVLTVYMAVRCIRRIDLVTVGAFIVQLCMLTTGVLTVAKRVMTIPAYEITLILFGILIPGTFLVFDYVNMKKRIKISNADVPLIERVEKQSNKDWTYKEYVETAEEWKTEIPYNTIVKTLNIGDKQLKSNLINQLSAVHKLIDVRDYKKALDNYMILTGILNHNPYIVYNAGWLYYRNGQYDDAIKMYKNSLNLIGEDANTKKDKKEDTEFNLRPILYFACGLCLYYQKKYELAIDQFELAQKDAGAIREVEINIARCYIAIKEFEEAQKHINNALKSKDDSKLRYILARICYERNENMECKFHLETIVEKDSEFTEAWVLLGDLYIKSKDWQGAEKAYKKLTSLVPDNADFYYCLGIAQRELGKTEEAYSSFEYAAEIMPEHSRALFSMASIYDAQAKSSKAIELLEKSLEGNEKLEMAYNLLAEIHISNDNINEAIHVYQKAVREHPDSYILHYNLGITLMMMRRYEEATRVFSTARKLSEDDPALYYNWASAEIGLKNYSEAAKLYKNGLKFKPDDEDILFGLAKVSALSGDVHATLAFLRQAIEINPALRLRAKASLDFAAFRTHPEFMELTRLPLRTERKKA